MLRQVMFARVADDEDDDRFFVERRSHAQRRTEISAGGTAAENSFQASQHARHLKRFTIRDVDHFVDVLDVNVWWDDLLADAFDEIRSRFDDLSGLFVRLEDRTVRIGADDANARILFFEKTAGAGNRAASAE